ncbi:MAG: aspartoacylase [Cyanobacteria bacterium CAN_BIN43]|nr:aspartoacylase [Cyanobacteria bacterium CAN_BIN43]
MDRNNRVAIVGGTHGNEWIGAYLVKKFEQFPQLIQREHVEGFTLLANPRAFAAGRRYIDKDLNRCFRSENLADLTVSSYEENRAKEICTLLKPKCNSQTDWIIDLHSSTANMGITIIPVSDHPHNLRLAAYLSSINPQVRVYRWQGSEQEKSCLRSVCSLGCAIEVGAIAQGTIDARLFQQTEEIVCAILDYLNTVNQETVLALDYSLVIYQGIEAVDYPRNEKGEIQAMIHPQLQSQDYQPLHPGAPMFLTFEGEPIAYIGDSVVYPVFINEAAYYEKGIAMCLTNETKISKVMFTEALRDP